MIERSVARICSCPVREWALKRENPPPAFSFSLEIALIRLASEDYQVMIHDDLTGRTDLSRQHIYRIRKHRRGICLSCTRPVAAESRWYCAEHLIDVRERERNRLGCKRRYYQAKSYLSYK